MTQPSRRAASYAKGLRAVVISFVANAALAAAKIMAGLLGHSYALIADGIESTMDIISSIVVWSSLRISAVPPDSSHPYGHGRAEPLAALVVALLLLVAAVGIAVQSILGIISPGRAPAPFTLIVLAVVIVTKEVIYRYLKRVGTDINSLAVTCDAWHHRTDAITSIAAFIGISVALLGGEGYESADGWAALLVCLIVAWNGLRLCRVSLADIMDAAISPEVEGSIRTLAESVPGVVATEKCLGRKSGLGFLIDLHVTVNGGVTVRQGHEIGHAVKAALCGADIGIHDVLVHVEPEAEATSRSAP